MAEGKCVVCRVAIQSLVLIYDIYELSFLPALKPKADDGHTIDGHYSFVVLCVVC